MGLVYIKKPDDARSKFCVTKLFHSFLVSSVSDLVQNTKDGFIIVESNFKVYAYTNDELDIAILKLFMREDYRFPNLVVGRLTRNSLKEAFNKRITAKQIMKFLSAHAHPQTQKQSQAHSLLLEIENENSIAKHFGLAKDRGLESLSQQLEIWESEMNCIQDYKGVLISFENQAQH